MNFNNKPTSCKAHIYTCTEEPVSLAGRVITWTLNTLVFTFSFCSLSYPLATLSNFSPSLGTYWFFSWYLETLVIASKTNIPKLKLINMHHMVLTFENLTILQEVKFQLFLISAMHTTLSLFCSIWCNTSALYSMDYGSGEQVSLESSHSVVERFVVIVVRSSCQGGTDTGPELVLCCCMLLF